MVLQARFDTKEEITLRASCLHPETYGKAKEIIKEFNPSQENKLKHLKISLKDWLETICALDAKILDALKGKKGIEEEIEEARDFSKQVLENVVEIECCLRKIKKKVEVVQHCQNPTATNATSVNKYAKLTWLTLKSFLGDPGQWLTFWDSFWGAVHENSELHKINKFNYLRVF